MLSLNICLFLLFATLNVQGVSGNTTAIIFVINVTREFICIRVSDLCCEFLLLVCNFRIIFSDTVETFVLDQSMVA